jgi:hypothetical protein
MRALVSLLVTLLATEAGAIEILSLVREVSSTTGRSMKVRPLIVEPLRVWGHFVMARKTTATHKCIPEVDSQN